MAIDSTYCHEMKLACATAGRIIVARPAPTEEQLRDMCLGNGNDDNETGTTVHECGHTVRIHSRSEEARKIAQVAGKRARR